MMLYHNAMSSPVLAHISHGHLPTTAKSCLTGCCQTDTRCAEQSRASQTCAAGDMHTSQAYSPLHHWPQECLCTTICNRLASKLAAWSFLLLLQDSMLHLAQKHHKNLLVQACTHCNFCALHGVAVDGLFGNCVGPQLIVGPAGPSRLINGQLVSSSVDVYIVFEYCELGDLFHYR